MTYTSLLKDYLEAGLDASKPTAATLAATIPVGSTAFYYATDTGKLYAVEGGGSAWVQLNGSATSIANLRVMANISGGSTTPAANTLSDIIDACIASTQGDVLYRGASGWAALAPGTSGQVLTTGGAGANPSWTTVSGGGGGSFRGCLATIGSSLIGVNYTTRAAVPWDSEIYDTDSIHSNVTNNTRLTVPSGVSYVEIRANVVIGNLNGQYCNVLFSKNGGSSFTGMAQTLYPYAFAEWMNAVSAVVPVTAGDYFECMLEVSGDTSVDISAIASWFAMEIKG